MMHQVHQMAQQCAASVRQLRHFQNAATGKPVTNQRGSGMSSSCGIPLYLHARARTHHEINASHARHAATALNLKDFFGCGIFLMPQLLFTTQTTESAA